MAEKQFMRAVLQLDALYSSGSTRKIKCLNRESRGEKDLQRLESHRRLFRRFCGGQILRVASIPSADWRHSGEHRNSRIKLNSISLEASATPPPANPEVSAPGVRRFIVKGPVHDVTSSWRPDLNKNWIRFIFINHVGSQNEGATVLREAQIYIIYHIKYIKYIKN